MEQNELVDAIAEWVLKWLNLNREAVVKTIPQDIFLSFSTGIALALSARYQLRSESRFWNPYFIRALIFQLLVFYPIGLCFAKFWTAWSWMYFIDPAAHSRWWTFIAVSSYIPAMAIGFHIGYTFIRLGEVRTAKIYMGIGYLGFAAMFFPLIPSRVIVVSDSFAAWASGTAPFIWNIGETYPFLAFFALVGVWYGGPLLYLMNLNKQEGLRIKSEEDALGTDNPEAPSDGPDTVTAPA